MMCTISDTLIVRYLKLYQILFIIDRYERESGISFIGKIIERKKALSDDECAEHCTSVVDKTVCQAFEYNKSNKRECTLYSTIYGWEMSDQKDIIAGSL